MTSRQAGQGQESRLSHTRRQHHAQTPWEVAQHVQCILCFSYIRFMSSRTRHGASPSPCTPTARRLRIGASHIGPLLRSSFFLLRHLCLSERIRELLLARAYAASNSFFVVLLFGPRLMPASLRFFLSDPRCAGITSFLPVQPKRSATTP